MGKLTAFSFITLDGYFEGTQKGDISWHKHGKEENQYAVDMLQQDNLLIFGRRTYEFMAGYWPTPYAAANDPALAAGMNRAEKIVFSRTMKKVEWHNTKLLKDNMEAAIRKRKESGKDMTLLGSGSVLRQLTDHGLIDEYQVMIDPVALGDGESLFKGIRQQLNLRLLGSSIFKSGVILLSYRPQA